MSGSPSRQPADDPKERSRRADQECDRFEAAWKTGQRPRIEDYLAMLPESERSALLRELILLEIDYRRLAGEHPQAEEFLVRFPVLDSGWIMDAVDNAFQPTQVYRLGPLLPPGSHRLGKFLLLQRLGVGGCGTVWQARDTELDRIVAIKILSPEFRTTPELRTRFQREAQAVARLSHPNVVTLFEVAEVAETPFLVLEFLEGTDLAKLVVQAGPLSLEQSCDYTRQAALGLQHAHAHGLVHRDIKPANLFLTAQGNVKILDLGLARLPQSPENAAMASLTQVGCVMGTVDFMAPEQIRDAHHADARADLYSLGCSLYYFLTGQVPFPKGSSHDKMLAHLTEQPPPVEQLRPEVSSFVAGVVRQLMARRPEDRLQTAAQLVELLETPHTAASGGAFTPEKAPKIAIVPTPFFGPRQRWVLVLFLVVIFGGVFVFLGLGGWFGQPEKSPIEDPKAGPPPFVKNSIGMKLVLIRPGRFQRGSDKRDSVRDENELPRREIRISQAFYLGVYEVTQREFQEVMKFNPSQFQAAQGGGSEHPVERVTFREAQRFCQELSSRPGEQQARRSYRLPTEAEWEYACRAGSLGMYHFGNDTAKLKDYAWYEANSGNHTHPVGQLAANPWGLHDMYGNVAEWCADWYEADYYAHSPAQDPLCTRPSLMRVLRGGTWGEYGKDFWCRSAARGRFDPLTKHAFLGMRVAFTVPGGTP